jgi:predicted CopG family antitoxin
MFTLTVRDERVYRQLMERVEQRGESLDEVLRELLDQEEDAVQAEEMTPALKLLKLIDAAELTFDHPFDARDAEDILSSETGEAGWRAAKDDDGSA